MGLAGSMFHLWCPVTVKSGLIHKHTGIVKHIVNAKLALDGATTCHAGGYVSDRSADHMILIVDC